MWLLEKHANAGANGSGEMLLAHQRMMTKFGLQVILRLFTVAEMFATCGDENDDRHSLQEKAD